MQSTTAAQTQTQANPYARPAQPTPIVNPYAASEQKVQPTANPYARPVAPISQQASQNGESQPAAPRRTRMQRYHEASSENDTGVQG